MRLGTTKGSRSPGSSCSVTIMPSSLCLAESEKLEAPEVITADFVYFRLRKQNYTAENRATIRQKVQRLLSEDRAIFLFFKHEDTPEGAVYAEEMLRRTRS